MLPRVLRRQGTPRRLYRDYSHEWDYLAWWFGPSRTHLAVERTVTCVERVEPPNVVDGLVGYDGLTAGFHLDYVDPVGIRQVTILGSEGHLVADVGAASLRWANRDGDQAETYGHTAADGLRAQLTHFEQVARRLCEPVVGWGDGVAALATAEALASSAETRGWVVTGPANAPS